MQDTSIERMEAALRAAVLRHREELRAERDAELATVSRGFLFARLGVPPATLATIATATGASHLPPSLRQHLGCRIAAEIARQLRLCRAQSPAYDLSRHIALARALHWIDGPVPKPDLPRPSGSILNRRFRPARRRSPLGTQLPSIASTRPPSPPTSTPLG